MWKVNVFVILYNLCLLFVKTQEESPWILSTTSLPDDQRLIPAVGNGHIATQVLGNVLYLNNVYNGYGNTSHRAKIPSPAGFKVNEEYQFSNYMLDMYQGVFKVQLTFPEGYQTEQVIYAHRNRSRILIHEVTVTRGTVESGDITVSLDLDDQMKSEDMDLTTDSVDDNTWYTRGNILEPETDTSEMVIIHMYWEDIPYRLTVPDGVESRTWRFITSVSIDQADCLEQFEAALEQKEMLLQEHQQAWESLWLQGSVNIQGNLTLWQTLNAAMFHILISTPDTVDPINQFAGLSPGGLARGGVVEPNLTSSYNDYLGHVFWDMDTWIMPAIMMFHPQMAQIMIRSRTRVMDAAADNAEMSGYRGIRYPWEQAYTGYEVCPWDLAALYQIHVTADVSYSLRQYLYSTRDLDFINESQGKQLAMDVARFWESRVVLMDLDKGYEILGVMGPDEYASNINNSVFTNYNALLSLQLPGYMNTVLEVDFTNTELEEITRFDEIAGSLYLPFDELLQYHPQYEGFVIENTTIKQSDVVLLGYPLMKNMTSEVRRNDLEIYEELTDKYGPDTGTWSMHTVGWMELNKPERAEDMFSNMLRNVNGPFKIFSEKPADGADGMRATNFITLAGGMLQAVMFGYGGIRLKSHQMDIEPYIPLDLDSWSLLGINYRGAEINLRFLEEGVLNITLVQEGMEQLLVYSWEDCTRIEVNLGSDINLPMEKTSFVALSDEENADLCQ